jgi:hypothetical protein
MRRWVEESLWVELVGEGRCLCTRHLAFAEVELQVNVDVRIHILV